MCGADQEWFKRRSIPEDRSEFPNLQRSRERRSKMPQPKTIYPVTPADTPPHIDGDIVYRHKWFLCRAVQDFVGNPKKGERSVRRGELVVVSESRKDWWHAMSETQGREDGWVPAMHLEIYDPDTDPTVYRDNSLEKPYAPLYLINPFDSSGKGHDWDRAKEFVRSYCNTSLMNIGDGKLDIELRDDGREYDLTTMPSIFEGLRVVYTFQKDRLAQEAEAKAWWEAKDKEQENNWVLVERTDQCQGCEEVRHGKKLRCPDCRQGGFADSNSESRKLAMRELTEEHLALKTI